MFDERDRIGDPSGMGEVFRGRAATGGDPVAIKRVRLHNPTEGAERRRAREVEIADRLTLAARSGAETGHLVLPVTYQVVDDDLLIVMPLADGSLQYALDTTTFDPATGLEVVKQVAQGLVELAAISIVHRDLKPANVLRYGATWRITDFGLARILSESTGTYTLAGWGTDPYIAPELWLNQPASVKSDLYALGVLAFEVFAGARPFPGPGENDFRRQHLSETPPELPTVPPRIARLILRMLSKVPRAQARKTHHARGRRRVRTVG
jgi:serine/threonine protein kinase